MMVTLEKIFDPAEMVLEQIEPKEVWMELEPAVGAGRRRPAMERPRGLPGRRVAAQTRPSGRRTRTGTPSRPASAPWWDKDSKAPAAARLERARKDFDNPLDIRRRDGRRGRTRHDRDREHHDRGPARSRAARRARLLPGRPGQPCAADKPIWLRPGGISSRHAQHRFYSHAGRYTGVFWPLNEDQVRTNIDAIEVVSVEAFRKRARQRGDFIEIGEDGNVGLIPDPADRGLPAADRDRAMMWTTTEQRG